MVELTLVKCHLRMVFIHGTNIRPYLSDNFRFRGDDNDTLLGEIILSYTRNIKYVS